MTAAEDDGPQTEQSMDDILASIRRIMLDEQARLKDGGAPEGPAKSPEMTPQAPFVLPPVPVESAVGGANVLVLDDSMAVMPNVPAPDAVPLPMTANLAAVEPVVDHALPVAHDAGPVMEETIKGAALPPIVAMPAPVLSGLTAQAIEDMLAPAAAAAAAASVEALLRKLAEERQALLQPASSSPTMEEFVRAELKPLLKTWLDENLPTIVERLVRAELARLTLRHGG
ncbi:DUF2497 domain-containing protein [Acidisoma cellulosilytica]|uniref:DUF2497 domain-containing protein n=1 Tax=Acidisoma cellulosilyticum TaxID=2802395 RepID=A0A963YZB5_9PROT|nr:DUF2497 domain-containing protein [Acidisoma cellulosilyticum]MCB8879654.1 DUF2497 domain-containing protein [Acidisoma cellulosilyticum]